MPSVFYRTYRPQKFSEVVGQELIKLTLSQAVKENCVANAYLFSGPRGTGKTTMARILAKAFNCVTEISKRENGDPCNECWSCKMLNEGNSLDIVEIDAASHTQVDKIRQLIENIDLAPVRLKYRIFIIDEVHMLSKSSFNALLKTLEEPPSHVVFILASTEKHKIPATIISRCQHFSFKLLSNQEIQSKLQKIADEEKIKVDEKSLSLISEAALGGMRDAESLFYQVVSLAGKSIDFGKIQNILGLSGRNNEIKLLEEVISQKSSKVLARIGEIVVEGTDIHLLCHNLLSHLRKTLLIKVNPLLFGEIEKEVGFDQAQEFQKLGNMASLSEIISLMRKIVEAQTVIKGTTVPHIPLEIALIEWIIAKGGKDFLGREEPKKAGKNGKKIKEEDFKPEKKPVKKDIAVKDEIEVEKIESESNLVKLERVSVSSTKKRKKKDKKNEKEQEAGSKKQMIDFGEVLKNWSNILSNIKSVQPALFSLLQVSSPVRIEDETLIVSTPYKFHKDKLNDLKNRKIFCEELKKISGLNRVCIIQDSAVTPPKEDKVDIIDQVQSLLG